MLYVFADEAGNFDFSARGTRYFIVVAVTMRNCAAGIELLNLRHELAMQETEMFDYGFHATEDKQTIRNQVFSVIQTASIEIDAVILDKRKTYPGIAANEEYFYQLAWNFLFGYMANNRLPKEETILVAAGSLGTKSKKLAFKAAIDKVIKQHGDGFTIKTAFWSAASHPCLQLADYCAWAIQRWKERGDDRSWKLIESKVSSCYEPFDSSIKLYY